MSHVHHQQHEPATPIWGRAKSIRKSHGFTAAQLARYAADGMIRTSHIRRPGQTRGVRLFHLGDLDSLIENCVEPGPENTNSETHRESGDLGL